MENRGGRREESVTQISTRSGTASSSSTAWSPQTWSPGKHQAAPGHGEIEQRRLRKPSSAEGGEILWSYAVSIALIHGLALFAATPWLFSWSGLVAAVVGLYVFGTLGVNLCYHRLLTHRGFKCPRRLEHFFSVLGVCCLQDTPARWVATHRMHHQHSDEQSDPHSPLATFLWSHVGWLVVDNRELNSLAMCDHYARDVLRDPFYLRFERNFFWLWTYLAHAALYYFVGFVAGWLSSGLFMGGVQFGLSLLVWGVFVRTVLVWHITWSVNSLTHLWGYQSYGTGENSRNNWFVALISNGEGWHNNHHADPRSASHGHKWWELDVTFLTILALEKLSVVRDVIRPRETAAQLSVFNPDGDSLPSADVPSADADQRKAA